MTKYVKKYESRFSSDVHYYKSDKSNFFRLVKKLYKMSKVNGKYILNGYKTEFMDFVGSINKYSKGEITKKELTRRFVSLWIY